MRQEYHFPKLSKAEQLECMKALQPLVQYCRANNLKIIPREMLLLPENRKALQAKQKLTLSLCSMIASICIKVGIAKSQINEVISYAQPAIDKRIVPFDFSHGSAFSSFVYLRIYGECIAFAKANNNPNETLVDDVSVFGEELSDEVELNFSTLSSDEVMLLDALFRFSEESKKPCGSIYDIVERGIVPTEAKVNAILDKLAKDK